MPESGLTQLKSRNSNSGPGKAEEQLSYRKTQIDQRTHSGEPVARRRGQSEPGKRLHGPRPAAAGSLLPTCPTISMTPEPGKGLHGPKPAPADSLAPLPFGQPNVFHPLRNPETFLGTLAVFLLAAPLPAPGLPHACWCSQAEP